MLCRSVVNAKRRFAQVSRILNCEPLLLLFHVPDHPPLTLYPAPRWRFQPEWCESQGLVIGINDEVGGGGGTERDR